MTFTTPDISSVSQSLHHWEIGEYISEGFVILGCAGEFVADLGEKWLGEKRKRRLERGSTMLLVVALTISLECIMRTNELSGVVIGSLGNMAEEANRKVRAAISDSSSAVFEARDALDKAGKAQESLGKAENEAKKAQAAASSALSSSYDAQTVASEARREADSFGRDIADAKKKAIETESHIASALLQADELSKKVQDASAALTELQGKVAWRTISSDQADILCRELQSVRGKHVSVVWVQSDPETNSFGNLLVKGLSDCGLGVSSTPVDLSNLFGPDISLVIKKGKDGLANTLAAAFIAARLAASPVSIIPELGIWFGSGDVMIIVGQKGRR